MTNSRNGIKQKDNKNGKTEKERERVIRERIFMLFKKEECFLKWESPKWSLKIDLIKVKIIIL